MGLFHYEDYGDYGLKPEVIASRKAPSDEFEEIIAHNWGEDIRFAWEKRSARKYDSQTPEELLRIIDHEHQTRMSKIFNALGAASLVFKEFVWPSRSSRRQDEDNYR